MMFTRRLTLAVVALFALAAPQLLGQEGASEGADGPSMEEVMAAYMKLGQPGEQHQALEPLAGKFEATNKSRMTPEAKWEQSKSEIESRWILGGRILEEVVHSNMMGMAFEGRGWWGYDNIKQQYWNIWADSMTTGTMMSTGQMKDGVLTLTGEYPDAMDGMKLKTTKMITKDITDDGFIFEMWIPDKNGRLFLHFVSECRRVERDASRGE